MNKKIIEKIKKLKLLQLEEMTEYINYAITKKHSGKMIGMLSVSTSCKHNKYCLARRNKKNCICKYCFADSQLSYQHTTANKMYINTLFLTNYDIPLQAIPLLNVLYFRFESFGDVQNVLQVKNYLTIATANSQVKMFVLWSKNPWIVQEAIDKYGKPDNFQLVYSEPMINPENAENILAEMQNKYPAIDKLFCVYTRNYAEKHNIKINCGANNCLACGKCYKRNTSKIIRELLK